MLSITRAAGRLRLENHRLQCPACGFRYGIIRVEQGDRQGPSSFRTGDSGLDFAMDRARELSCPLWQGMTPSNGNDGAVRKESVVAAGCKVLRIHDQTPSSTDLIGNRSGPLR